MVEPQKTPEGGPTKNVGAEKSESPKQSKKPKLTHVSPITISLIAFSFILILILVIYSTSQKNYPEGFGLTPVNLLFPTVLSVAASAAVSTLLIKTLSKQKSDYLGRIITLSTIVAIIFTWSIIVLCFDIWPFPEPTTKWIWVWIGLFLAGWLLHLITLVLSLEYNQRGF